MSFNAPFRCEQMRSQISDTSVEKMEVYIAQFTNMHLCVKFNLLIMAGCGAFNDCKATTAIAVKLDRSAFVVQLNMIGPVVLSCDVVFITSITFCETPTMVGTTL